jgi:ankyrin repeat protein
MFSLTNKKYYQLFGYFGEMYELVKVHYSKDLDLEMNPSYFAKKNNQYYQNVLLLHFMKLNHNPKKNKSITFDLVKFLIENKSVIDFRDKSSNSSLHLAASNDFFSTDILRLLIDGKAMIGAVNGDRKFAVACCFNSKEINFDKIKFLIESKSPLQLDRKKVSTVLHFACKHPKITPEIIQYLRKIF